MAGRSNVPSCEDRDARQAASAAEGGFERRSAAGYYPGARLLAGAVAADFERHSAAGCCSAASSLAAAKCAAARRRWDASAAARSDETRWVAVSEPSPAEIRFARETGGHNCGWSSAPETAGKYCAARRPQKSCGRQRRAFRRPRPRQADSGFRHRRRVERTPVRWRPTGLIRGPSPPLCADTLLHPPAYADECIHRLHPQEVPARHAIVRPAPHALVRTSDWLFNTY
jgi:hypothetical protein